MTADLDPRLRDWLERADVRDVDPERIDAVRHALGAPEPPVSVHRARALTVYAPGRERLRLVELDRFGHLVAAWRWTADGTLAWAKCRTTTDGWIGLEPGAVEDSPLGPADRLWRLDADATWNPVEELTVASALDYTRPDFIPPLLDPGRLPTGAGTAVLNLIAGLMKDRGMAPVRYRGPYPTEQLFTALLECFRYDAAVDDPLGRFMQGGALDWVPAPHERHCPADGVWVQQRHDIEKVVLDGVAFHRRDWQGVIRHEPRVVRREGDRVVCSLWALGRAIEDRLVLDLAGAVRERPSPATDGSAPAPLAPVWIPALAELIARESAPALGASIRNVVAALALEWGPVPGDLMRADGARIRLSRRLRDVAVGWIREGDQGPDRGRRAIAYVLEVARLLGPAVRQRAQAHLAALPVEQQLRALEIEPVPAGDLPAAVGKLIALVAADRA